MLEAEVLVLADKMRVHILAKALNVPSKIIIDKCQAEGLDVTNHMSTLSAGLEATIREWFSEGQHATTVETADRVDLTKVRLPKRRLLREGASSNSGGATVLDAPPGVDDPSLLPSAESDEPGPPESMSPATTLEESSEAPGEEFVAADVPVAAESRPNTADVTAMGSPSALVSPEESDSTAEAPAAELVSPAGPQNVPQPAKLKGPRVVRYEAPEPNVGPFGPRRRTPEPGPAGAPSAAPWSPADSAGRRRGVRSRGAAAEAAAAAKAKAPVRKLGESDLAAEKLKEWRDQDLAERQERISDATGRRIHVRRPIDAPARRGTQAGPKTEASVLSPVVMRDLCAATGISMLQMLPILQREFGTSATINTELADDAAEYVCAELGVTLTIRPPQTAMDKVREEFVAREPKDVRPRAPVVTFLGHVDHGKTSLLDAIRRARVAASEDGGITQHIGAYRLDHPTAGSVTFLDTPGHEAFTAMRARGARLTDVAVLVVAADDGLMPQTLEAINHAKAAGLSGVSLLVALNKIDLGTQNVNKIYGQLAEQGLQPSGDWGGDTDVIHTSATTGEGIPELVEHLAALGEVLDLKAPHGGPATGTVIDAQLREGVGAVVRVLVQQGVLNLGDAVVCGTGYGKVRALLDDRGQRLKEAGPSIPVEIWGLDGIPAAGETLFEVASMQRAKEVAEDERSRQSRAGLQESRRVWTLEDVFTQRDRGEVPELNVIIRGDVDGSVDALKTMLGKIPSDQVRLTIRQAAVGPVNDGDILLAEASKAVIIAFRVTPSSGAKKLADEKGVAIRSYKVIYDVADDMRKAMEGLLSPDEKVEWRAAAQVREVFRVSKVGQVAGCYVSEGTIQRNHLVRLVRDGTVVRDGCKLGSLRRFKDDVKEVRAGMECGIRIEGFDDVKAGDVIESYEVAKIARKL